ncbi:MAG: hypothetical protein V7L29_15455 [Nostoc sp.]|uniref:hypothetical protein n=1 Tax=Nostoc sp. TaxID=1180 RepID=UPI002FF3CC99
MRRFFSLSSDIARQIVVGKYGGAMPTTASYAVNSISGEGTEFVITLPVKVN